MPRWVDRPWWVLVIWVAMVVTVDDAETAAAVAARYLGADRVPDLRRGRGATVTDVSVDRERVLTAIDQLLREAREAGVGRDELRRLVEERG